MSRRFRKVLWVTVAVVAVGLIAVAWANLAAVLAGKGRLYEKVAEVPGDRVGLVFGTSPWIGDRENLYFRYRIDAAAELWKAGKLRCILVSGDNENRNYNEPEYMADALVEAGVPREMIVADYAGFRTLDTVYRAKEVFGVRKVTFISQKFHNERAAYLAKAKGLDYVGFNARDVEGQGGLKTKLREIGARVKMWLDVRVLGTEPRHYGDKEELPG
ncbi:vancomycin high temperature exclusion protein [Haloferula sp. A504]|uniref:vancomycin high temperature exclusion protein n=1 Tax=Haloferula sp. A504 TaxID=3373601 RepID=UPI0031C68CFF|nr:YdcF family protein [Verrucomicrobiaceae bacterium E54]